MRTLLFFSESPNVKRDSLNGKRNRNSQSRIRRNLSDSFSSDKTLDNSPGKEEIPPAQNSLTSKFKFDKTPSGEKTHCTSEQSGVISENSTSTEKFKFLVPNHHDKLKNSAEIKPGKHATLVFTVTSLKYLN